MVSQMNTNLFQALPRRLQTILFASFATLFLLSGRADAVVGITAFSSSMNTTNFQTLNIAPGLNVGADGFWFANFNASTAQSLQPVNANNANSLPSFISVDFNKETSPGVGNPLYGFANQGDAAYGALKVAYSDGGQQGYNSFTLPNGTTGLSGQLVDTLNSATTSSDTITTRWFFGPGTPDPLYISIVLDNTGTASPPNGPTVLDRLRVSNFDHLGNSSQATFGAPLTNNGTADVYTFKLTGIDTIVGANGPGFFSIQVRTAGDGVGLADAGLAGVMFAPEPSSIAMLAMGACGALAYAVRRKLGRK